MHFKPAWVSQSVRNSLLSQSKRLPEWDLRYISLVVVLRSPPSMMVCSFFNFEVHHIELPCISSQIGSVTLRCEFELTVTPESQGPAYGDGLPTAEVFRLLEEAQSGSYNTPRSGFRSDIATVDNNSTSHFPIRGSEYENVPALSVGDTGSMTTGDPSTPRTVAGISPSSIAEYLARRPDDEFRFEDYIYNSDTPADIREHMRQGGGIVPSPGTKSHLPCPFRSLDGCDIMFDVREKELWKWHALMDHFKSVPPPLNLVCTFKDATGKCEEKFATEEGRRILNWRRKMGHFAQHYEDRLSALLPVFHDSDSVVDARALSEVTDTRDEHFESYICRERRRLESIRNPNHLARSLGGPRYREVVATDGLWRSPPEQTLDSTNATQYAIASSSGHGPDRSERIILR